MKRILISLFICFSCLAYAQLPKHVEFASEPADTMVLINKQDLDIINTAFYNLEKLDSLNIINEMIINTLKIENNTLNEIISKQGAVIVNKNQLIENIQQQNRDVISDLEKQVKMANRKTVFWKSTTGIGIIAAFLLAIF